MWMKCPQGMAYDATSETCTGTNSTFQYCDADDNSCNGGSSGNPLDGNGNSEAWDTCDNLSYAGYTDWRVPNKEELTSLIHCSNGHVVTGDYPDQCSLSGIFDSPTIDTSLFPNFPETRFWTSVSEPGGGNGCLVAFDDGHYTCNYTKTFQWSVLCVR